MKKIIAAAFAVLLIVGLVYASIPGSDGVIHACYRNSTGDLRAVDSTSPTCRGDETSLTWNQVGPQGPPGPTSLSTHVIGSGLGAVGNGVMTLLPSCQFNEAVLGGGFRVTDHNGVVVGVQPLPPEDAFTLLMSAPMWSNSAGNQNNPGWIASIVVDPNTFTGILYVWAICAPGTTTGSAPSSFIVGPQ